MMAQMKKVASAPTLTTRNGSKSCNEQNRGSILASTVRFENPMDAGRPFTVTVEDGRAVFTLGEDPLTAYRFTLTEVQVARVHLMLVEQR